MDIITKNKIYSKYINYKDIDLSNISYINNIPRLVHRTLLFDSEFPSEFAKLFILFNYNSLGYKTILWREKDLLEILNNGEKHIYSSYKHKIQKMDFARYIILQKYGGVYADFDIHLKVHLDKVLQTSNKGFICLEERGGADTRLFRIRQTLPLDKRQEHKIRIANYFIASSKNHKIWTDIMRLCCIRSTLNVREAYDVLFTTGPDVVTTTIHNICYPNYKEIHLLMWSIAGNMIEHVRKTSYHKKSNYWKKLL
jgi:hypothetical protein